MLPMGGCSTDRNSTHQGGGANSHAKMQKSQLPLVILN